MCMNPDRPRRAKIRSIVGILAAALLVCGAAARLLDRPVRLRSDAPGVEFTVENDRIVSVSVRGQFPYLRVDCPMERQSIRDASGRVTETICTYTMQARPAFLGQNMATMKLSIEAPADTVYTYVLKFAERDITIVNGKVVDPSGW